MGKHTEIWQHGYIITAGNRAWFFDGTDAEARKFKETIKDLPWAAGKTVRMRKVI